jgi:hypothetical protein
MVEPTKDVVNAIKSVLGEHDQPKAVEGMFLRLFQNLIENQLRDPEVDALIENLQIPEDTRRLKKGEF